MSACRFEATIENGCLQVIPGSHRKDLVAHCPTEQGLAIPDKLLPTQAAVPLPMRPGSLLLMTQRTMHSSLDNVSPDDVRISFDLRYQPVGQPTGRPSFPGFVARSKARPETVLRDPEAWSRSWYDARARLAEEDDPGAAAEAAKKRSANRVNTFVNGLLRIGNAIQVAPARAVPPPEKRGEK